MLQTGLVKHGSQVSAVLYVIRLGLQSNCDYNFHLTDFSVFSGPSTSVTYSVCNSVVSNSVYVVVVYTIIIIIIIIVVVVSTINTMY